jgi:hypothetical protein
MNKLLLASLLFFASLSAEESTESQKLFISAKIIAAATIVTIGYIFYEAKKIIDEGKHNCNFAPYNTFKKFVTYSGAVALSGVVIGGASRFMKHLYS